MRRIIITLCLFVSLCSGWLEAQTVKRITLSATDSYTEHLAMSNDLKDFEVMVKFIFDEANNRLSVTLLSYRSLFVFQEDARYKQVVRSRKLRPERLPYVLESPVAKIKLSKEVRRQIPKPRKKFIFERWISVDGLQPVPQAYKLVNDYIEQSFDIIQQREEVTVSLHHLFFMDSEEKKNKEQRMWLSYFKDLNLEYYISLKRNPCIGTEVEMEQATAALENVKQSYEAFRKNFSTDQVRTEGEYNQFMEMKRMLMEQFVCQETKSQCTEVQQLWEEYNTYVRSIHFMECTLVEPDMPGIEADVLLRNARQIDSMVTDWLSSTDKVERRDLHVQCLKLIEEINGLLEEYGIANEEQQRALNVFRGAEKYFQNTINLKK